MQYNPRKLHYIFPMTNYNVILAKQNIGLSEKTQSKCMTITDMVEKFSRIGQHFFYDSCCPQKIITTTTKKKLSKTHFHTFLGGHYKTMKNTEHTQ